MPKRAFIITDTDHGTMIVPRMDCAPDGGYGVGVQLLDTGSFEWEECTRMAKILGFRKRHHGDGVVALDCGANIGAITVFVARLMQGWGRVIAIEAQERLFYALAGNIAIQNAFNARAIWAAVDDCDGTIRIPEPDYTQYASYGSFELDPRDRVPENIGQAVDYKAPTSIVEKVYIDSLRLERVDFIKLDIEGMELRALNGAQDTIERCKPALWVEHIKVDKAELEKFVGDRGYNFGYLGINFVAVHKDDPTSQHYQFANQARVAPR